MTLKEIKIPDLGDAEDVEVIEICVSPGDSVGVDDPIIVLESEKAAMEIPASIEGKVIDIKVSNGDTVKEGTIFLEIEAKEIKKTKQEKASQLPESKIEEKSDLKNTLPKTSSKEIFIQPKSSENIHAGPAVRKLAREFGIDLSKVSPTGPRGRILKEDLHEYVKEQLNSNKLPTSKNPQIDYSLWGEVKKEPLTKFQKTAASNLQQSWRNIPHVTQHDEANIDALMKLSEKLNKNSGLKISPLAFFVKATAKLLEEFPLMNASLDENTENIIFKDYINIGIAVDTPKGLIVPNIKNTNKLSIQDISKEVSKLAKAAKERKIKVDELKGSTFTISSLGAIGGKFFTPIVNPPEVGILGISRTFSRVDMIKNNPVSSLILPISLSYDHRVINGVEAVKFTSRFCELLEDTNFFEINY